MLLWILLDYGYEDGLFFYLIADLVTGSKHVSLFTSSWSQKQPISDLAVRNPAVMRDRLKSGCIQSFLLHESFSKTFLKIPLSLFQRSLTRFHWFKVAQWWMVDQVPLYLTKSCCRGKYRQSLSIFWENSTASQMVEECHKSTIITSKWSPASVVWFQIRCKAEFRGRDLSIFIYVFPWVSKHFKNSSCLSSMDAQGLTMLYRRFAIQIKNLLSLQRLATSGWLNFVYINVFLLLVGCKWLSVSSCVVLPRKSCVSALKCLDSAAQQTRRLAERIGWQPRRRNVVYHFLRALPDVSTRALRDTYDPYNMNTPLQLAAASPHLHK